MANPYKAPKSELQKIDSRQQLRNFSIQQQETIIPFNGNSEDPDVARVDNFNLWDED